MPGIVGAATEGGVVIGEARASSIDSSARKRRQIVAFGGGGFSMEAGNPLLDDYVLSLTGRARPKVCFLPSASGDADHYVVRFYREFTGARAEASHISLFRRHRGVLDVRSHLLAQDLIYVGGGSLVSLIGVWRAHGIDAVLREAWAAGVVLCGLSAGALCWFADALSAYYGAPERVEGLGLLPWSFTAHYDSEPERRERFHRSLEEGMRAGFAADDGAALHFAGPRLHRIVASRPGAGAYALRCDRGHVVEERFDAEFLGTPAPPDPVPITAVA
jgi:dipeptidase E